MKKNFVAVLALLLFSLACQTLFPKNTTPPDNNVTAEPTQRGTPSPIVCTDDSCINACLERINNTLETRRFDSIGGDYAGAEANFDLVKYQVENGAISDPEILYVPKEFKPFQDDLQAQQTVWKYASSLLTENELKWITEYVVFTDGESNTLAWVNNKDDLDLSRWQLGVDIIDAADPVDLTATLIHEFGHLITLNSEQFTPTDYYYGWNQNNAACPQFTSPEGCSTPDSYINLFYQNFWIDIFDEWLETVENPQVDTDEEFDALRRAFYSKHSEQFVREYAATNIREDMAESFMHFVLTPQPNGNNPVEQKMLFFYQFEELTTLRRQIIQNVCSYTQE